MQPARTVAGTRLQGDRQQRDDRLPDVPAVQGANAPFTLVSYGSWVFEVPDPIGSRGRGVQPDHLVHEDGEWMPELKAVIHKAGCNGAREVDGPDGRKVVNMTGTYAGIVNKGGVVIAPYDRRLPEEFQGYVARWGVKGQTAAFHAFYTTEPRIFGRNVRPVADHDWICRFKRFLVTAGFVPPMDSVQLDEHLQKITNRIQDRFEKMGLGSLTRPAYDVYAASQNELSKRMVFAFDRQFGDGQGGEKVAPAGQRLGAPVVDAAPSAPLGRKK